jgi:hypothetical protein
LLAAAAAALLFVCDVVYNLLAASGGGTYTRSEKEVLCFLGDAMPAKRKSFPSHRPTPAGGGAANASKQGKGKGKGKAGGPPALATDKRKKGHVQLGDMMMM